MGTLRAYKVHEASPTVLGSMQARYLYPEPLQRI